MTDFLNPSDASTETVAAAPAKKRRGPYKFGRATAPPVAAEREPFLDFATLARWNSDWTRPGRGMSYEQTPEFYAWWRREETRWLIIRATLRACEKKGIGYGEIDNRMNLQGCPGEYGLYDLLRYIAKDWNPDNVFGMSDDHQWLAGYDIEFCRATDDWSLIDFTLGLIEHCKDTPADNSSTPGASGLQEDVGASTSAQTMAAVILEAPAPRPPVSMSEAFASAAAAHMFRPISSLLSVHPEREEASL